VSELYAVFCPKTCRFVGKGQNLSWTADRAEAELTARMMDGVVVDAEDFRANWPMYVLMSVASDETPVDVAAKSIPRKWLEYVRNQDSRRNGT